MLFGYIFVGVLIGLYMLGVLVVDFCIINDIFNFGVVLLMFMLGLEFSI